MGSAGGPSPRRPVFVVTTILLSNVHVRLRFGAGCSPFGPEVLHIAQKLLLRLLSGFTNVSGAS